MRDRERGRDTGREQQLRQPRVPGATVSYEQIRNRRLQLAASAGPTPLPPTERFASQQRVLRALRIDRAEAIARGEESLAENYAEAIARQQKQLRNLEALVVASKIPYITTADNGPQALSRLPEVARRTVAAGGAGLLVAAGIAAALELAAYRRSRGQADDRSGTQSHLFARAVQWVKGQ